MAELLSERAEREAEERRWREERRQMAAEAEAMRRRIREMEEEVGEKEIGRRRMVRGVETKEVAVREVS